MTVFNNHFCGCLTKSYFIFYFLSNSPTFCEISFTDVVNLVTYCENLRTLFTPVEINSKESVKKIAFHWYNLISNHLRSTVANFKQISRITRFLRNFLPQKLWSQIYKYQVCQSSLLYANFHSKMQKIELACSLAKIAQQAWKEETYLE